MYATHRSACPAAIRKRSTATPAAGALSLTARAQFRGAEALSRGGCGVRNPLLVINPDGSVTALTSSSAWSFDRGLTGHTR
jgi:hypothetical protein